MFKSSETLIKHVVASSGPDLMGLHLNASDWPNKKLIFQLLIHKLTPASLQRLSTWTLNVSEVNFLSASRVKMQFTPEILLSQDHRRIWISLYYSVRESHSMRCGC